MSNPDKPNVTVTRWWWVRHAPVRSDGGNIYGQEDIDCDTGDIEVFEAVAKMLPRNAVWYASNLKRTHQTAEAIWAAGFPKPANMIKDAAFAELHLGRNFSDYSEARPGDFMKIFWTEEIGQREHGHSVVYLGTYSTGGQDLVRFWSSNMAAR